MIIREIEIENVRSYEHALIRLPLGKTLFEGDIGSGKSSILMAIEFALFGLGSETGASLLRLGEKKGAVRMKFEVEGREFEVSRGLERKGGGVQQTGGRLVTPEEELDLSPRELKEKVLEVLEFNEAPDPKAQSLIYRYAVYTPQEEMKEVLSMSQDVRLQTLRRAFRVEDYKTAAENSSEISRELRGDIRELEGFGAGLDRLRGQMEELMRDEEEHTESLGLLRKAESESEETLVGLKAERGRLHEQQLGMEGFRAEKQMQERLQKEGAREVAGLERELEDIGERASKLGAFLEKRSGRRPPSRRTPAQFRALESEAESEVKRLTALKATVESKLDDYGTIMKKGVCPVCDRKVEAHDFARKKESKELEREHVSEEMEKAEEELRNVRNAREQTEKYLGEKEIAAEKRTELARLRNEVMEKEGELEEARGKQEATRERLGVLGLAIRELEEVSAKLASTERKIAQVEETMRKTRDRMAAAGERLRGLDKRKAELTIEMVAKEGAGARRDVLREDEVWLSGYFEPTVQLIERSVLATINQEFDSLFQKWFAMLVGDPEKEAKVDEDFTPVVVQGGYEQDVRYLSGGERTSVALAYRLALNLLAQRVSAGMRSNLLILDEPTDGFSREQLGNVREVLDDVGCPQVIIVSHDKELESFADQILRVSKSRGVSTVESPEAR